MNNHRIAIAHPSTSCIVYHGIDQNTRDVSPSDDHQTMTRDLKQNTLLTRVIYTRVLRLWLVQRCIRHKREEPKARGIHTAEETLLNA